ncbi:MAG: heme-binding protein [Dehalococcoidia bacterium]|jgi:uncharacterized protein GlcG (DUF336 family)
MYQRQLLGLAEARTAVDAILVEASKEPDLPIAVAVVDYRGDVICLVVMDKSSPFFSRVAMNRAYTAAQNGINTLDFGKRMRDAGRTLADFGDPRYTTLQGGVCITKPSGQEFPPAAGTVLGGIGVSGRKADEDERLAYIGLKAMSL